jgi:hypothetical protein
MGRIAGFTHSRADCGRKSQGLGFWARQLLFVGDLPQLPPVVKNIALPISRRMITRLSCWPGIQKFILREQHLSENFQWANVLAQVATGSVEDIQL